MRDENFEWDDKKLPEIGAAMAFRSIWHARRSKMPSLWCGLMNITMTTKNALRCSAW
jgi:hypothetical protein